MSRAIAILLAVSFAIAGLFAYGRGSSAFLAAERDVEAAREVARQHGLSPGEVLALREGVGVVLPVPTSGDRAARYAAELTRWKSKRLAILALYGEERLIAELMAGANGDVTLAELALGRRPEQVQVVRFLSVADRFDQRLSR